MDLLPHEKLKLCRMRKSMTQEQLAALLHCSQMEVSRMERGKKPNPNLQGKIEKILDAQIWPRGGEIANDF
jgi:transcriptional regulator with XRE-family HTH domain